jgi:FeS assembly protein IscX
VKRTWRDIGDIARDLARQYPETDPLALELPQLRAMITGLPGFGDVPEAGTDEILEAIQSAWYDQADS